MIDSEVPLNVVTELFVKVAGPSIALQSAACVHPIASLAMAPVTAKIWLAPYTVRLGVKSGGD